ncbi:hypothetical protein ACROYT_G005140 [Oculina patagonica]
MAAHLFRFGCFVVLLLGLKQTQGEPFQAPTYTIDLDLAPEERWVNITKKYAEYSAQIMAAIHTRIPAFVFPLVEKLAVSMDEHFPEPFPAEMKGVSKGLNLSLADTILLNIFYDLSAFCTSIVAQDKDGNVFHGRNLDYSFSETLRNLTFISNFQSKGKVIYTGVTFAGQVGLLTAQRPKSVTITLDERDQGFLWENIFEAIFNKNAVPITFLIRDVVSTDGMDFTHAVKKLSHVSLIADGYLIVGGVKVGEGAVVTRNRESTADVWKLSPDAAMSPWFLVETNYDHWTTPPPSDDRRHPAEKALTKLTQGKLTPQSLFKVMSIHPVLNNKTVYTTIMQAKDPDLFNTWIQRP